MSWTAFALIAFAALAGCRDSYDGETAEKDAASGAERCGPRPSDEGQGSYPAWASPADCGTRVCGAFYEICCPEGAEGWQVTIMDCFCGGEGALPDAGLSDAVMSSENTVY